MAPDGSDLDLESFLGGLRRLQAEFRSPVADVEVESPRAAIQSLDEALDQAPRTYRDYLRETVECYENGQFRAAVLMIWAATMAHLYETASQHKGGLAAFEAASKGRFHGTRREVKKRDDFMYLRDYDFIQLGEDAGMFNKNIRELLHQRLKTRNNCGHPTGYQIGRQETVAFIEGLVLNILGGAALNW